MIKEVLIYPLQLVSTQKRQHTSDNAISYYYSTSLEQVTEQHARSSVDKPFTANTNSTQMPPADSRLSSEPGQHEEHQNNRRKEQAILVSGSTDVDNILDNRGEKITEDVQAAELQLSQNVNKILSGHQLCPTKWSNTFANIFLKKTASMQPTLCKIATPHVASVF